MTSFVASFVLIRYRLIDVKDHLPPVAPKSQSSIDSRPPYPTTKFESAPGVIEATHSKDSTAATPVHSSQPPIAELTELMQRVTETVSELEGRVFVQTSPLSCFLRSGKSNGNGTYLDPPVRLLSRCHTLAVTMAMCGFVLALLGILSFAWTALPTSISIFSSVCLAGCLGAVFVVTNLT